MKRTLLSFAVMLFGLFTACSLQSQPAQVTFAISGSVYGELEPCG